MKNKIICIGNRFVENDCAGIKVYEYLLEKRLPDNTELIEGGIAGLNLLPFLEDASTVVFVDSISGFSGKPSSLTPHEHHHKNGECICKYNKDIVVLKEEDIKQELNDPHYGHHSGVAYLLTIFSNIYRKEHNCNFFLVGLEGECCKKKIEEAAKKAILIINKLHKNSKSTPMII
ncbi:putative Hydrogenase maturation protease [Desulfamplus magnetovallimortis]|uniref:Putative Hydrogenase maturation protease n=1 Tax=Desulfamplus magnetovallimortis TaxID=1246637 RepID=A0A1W1HIA7_9BACT|nr:hypothetical protein [Desulfamplus magnetovallimortis]SLM32241.1 putative Hydrogenase maturation protease [Desulfamplus magnetovallimortis]